MAGNKGSKGRKEGRKEGGRRRSLEEGVVRGGKEGGRGGRRREECKKGREGRNGYFKVVALHEETISK